MYNASLKLDIVIARPQTNSIWKSQSAPYG